MHYLSPMIWHNSTDFNDYFERDDLSDIHNVLKQNAMNHSYPIILWSVNTIQCILLAAFSMTIFLS